MSTTVVPWGGVEPLPPINGDVQPILDSVESLREAWRDVVHTNDEAFQEARRQNLRRHAVETGIIERLYEVSWGVTEALVAEGITGDAVAHANDGPVSEDVLATIRSQYDALQFLVEAARQGRQLSTSFIRELHVALTQYQPTYEATGPAGIRFKAALHHGQWKEQPNHVTRPDGTVLEYTPPEQVQPQIDRLIELYGQYDQVNPIIRSAWLHHRFVRIHPFEDGNGRVARCLTLLTLLQNDLAPLVVYGGEREQYLRWLDAANDGDLRPLIRFFARLEIVALRRELERHVEVSPVPTVGDPVAVLRASLARLHQPQGVSAAERAERIAALAFELQTRVTKWLKDMAAQIHDELKGVDRDAEAWVATAAPPDEKARWWRRQIITTARSGDFFVNLRDGVWWDNLRLRVFGQELRYLVFMQKVGHGERGVLALTVFAETPSTSEDRELGRAASESDQIVVSTPTESVTWTYNDTVDSRWDDVTDVLDTTLAAALRTFTSTLG